MKSLKQENETMKQENESMKQENESMKQCQSESSITHQKVVGDLKRRLVDAEEGKQKALGQLLATEEELKIKKETVCLIINIMF